MNTLTKLASTKKFQRFLRMASKMNLGVSTVVGLLSAVDRVPVEVAPFSRSTKLLADLAESSGRQVTQNDGDGTLLVRPAVLAEPVLLKMQLLDLWRWSSRSLLLGRLCLMKNELKSSLMIR